MLSGAYMDVFTRPYKSIAYSYFSKYAEQLRFFDIIFFRLIEFREHVQAFHQSNLDQNALFT